MAKTGLLIPPILLWLACALAGGATVAAVEIGAVALAVGFGYAPKLAIMTVGAAFAGFGQSVVLKVIGAVLIGAVLAPLATWYALVLEDLAPEHRRAEVFALLRTAHANGIITASPALTVAPVSTALILVTAMMAVVTLAVALASRPGGWS